MAEGEKNSLGPGCIILFSLPFLLVGLFMLGLTVWTVVQSLAVRNWDRVPAQVLQTELTHSTSSSSSGGSSTTHKVTAKYRYTYKGNTYTGDRVSLHGGSDNIGSFHERTHKLLRKHRQSGEPIDCWVNPKTPSESLLFASPRFELLGFYMLFALVFGGFGFAAFIFAWRNWRKQRRQGALADERPEEPWLWNEAWRNGKIRSSNKIGLWGMVGFAVVWNLISAPLVFFLPGEIAKGNKAAAIGFIFPVVGLFLVIGAVYMILRWLKYGDSVFELNTVPGVMGGTLEGIIRTSAKVRPQDGFRVQLECVNRVTTGSGKNRSTRETILWQASERIGEDLLRRDPSRTAIPVNFTIPYDLRETSPERSDNCIVWKLKVTAATAGIDYAAEFEVPVFRTIDSQEDMVESTLAASHEPTEINDLAAELRRQGAFLQRHGAGVDIRFPMGRNKKAGCVISIIFLIWTGVCVGLMYSDAPIMFPIVFGLFDLLLFYGVLHTWFNSSKILVRNGQVEYSGGIFGLGSSKRFRGDAIDRFKAKANGQTGQTIYYELIVHTKDGKEHELASGIPDKTLVDRLGATIRDLSTGQGG